MIPKYIHQVYLGFDNPEMPDKWKKNHEMWKKIHPDHEVLLWNMENSLKLMQKINPDFIKIFKSYPHNIQRADAIRPFILYEYGGIYADLDTYPNRHISPLIDVYSVDKYEVLISSSANTKSPSNWFMASMPKSKFWMDAIREMINRANKNYFLKHLQIMNTAGPKLIEHIMNKNPTISVMIHPELLNSTNICNNKINALNYVHDEHASSWNGSDTHIVNTIFCTLTPLHDLPWHSWTLILFICLIIIIGISYKLRECKLTKLEAM